MEINKEKKDMKKYTKNIIIVLVLLLLMFSISIPIVNNISAYLVASELKEIPLPERTEYIDSVSKAAKMTGNGNGMQYMGAILVESELSLKELDEYFADYRTEEWECIVEAQEGQNVNCVEHGTLSFDEKMSSDKQYYIVYSWGSGIEPFSELDIRGH